MHWLRLFNNLLLFKFLLLLLFGYHLKQFIHIIIIYLFLWLNWSLELCLIKLFLIHYDLTDSHFLNNRMLKYLFHINVISQHDTSFLLLFVLSHKLSDLLLIWRDLFFCLFIRRMGCIWDVFFFLELLFSFLIVFDEIIYIIFCGGDSFLLRVL